MLLTPLSTFFYSSEFMGFRMTGKNWPVMGYIKLLQASFD
jgi:hypothetical protein